MAHEPLVQPVVRDESNDDPNSPLTVYFGVLGCVILVVSIVGLQVIFNAMARQEYEDKTFNSVPPALELYQNEQIATLNSYGWVDQTNGVARIPIDRAMELAARDLK